MTKNARTSSERRKTREVRYVVPKLKDVGKSSVLGISQTQGAFFVPLLWTPLLSLFLLAM